MSFSSRPTQEFVPIKEIRGGTIVMKDDSLRAIVAVSSVNLALKSADEQMATLSQFQGFLNSLDFRAQIVVQSRRLDIRPYLLVLEGRMKELHEPLLRLQTGGYISFIREFTEQVAIMKKRFYVVIPYEEAALSSSNGGIFGNLFGGNKRGSKKGQKSEAETSFEERQTQLDERVSITTSGLESCGMRTERLNTEEIVELFYKTFNPGDTQPAINLQAIGLGK